MERRDFLKMSAAAIGVAAVAGNVKTAKAADAAPGKMKKALQLGMLPKELSDAEKFKLAKACGFDGIEGGPVEDLGKAKELGELARAAGTPIHSIVYGGWKEPMSSPEEAVQAKGVKAMEAALHSAKALGADAVLLVPAVVNESTRYVDAYTRSQANIRKLLPLAQELQVTIAVEFVWNNFLLSPLEFAKYIDEFNHPYLKAYFDTGNVVAYGWTEDWIRTLGNRIVKVHLKDFKRKNREWTNLRDGDVNWPEVNKAFGEAGYTGYVTPELSGGDEAYLKDLSARIDLILEGK
jgi:hexulose-6-phosphate isomerase